jgi:aryl-alcohol dehydrogenase-like predicted oxidoreductase
VEYTQYGRTGLEVSVAGLGCGGSSKLGLATGHSEADAIDVVLTAVDLGINLIDTAARYGTEDVVGRAIAQLPRDRVVISTKVAIHAKTGLLPLTAITDSLDQSLRRLRTDHIDIYHLHGILPEHYDHIREHVLPVLRDAQTVGKVRFIGVTESPITDIEIAAMPRAVADGCWDSLMIACHMMHQQPIERVLRPAREQGAGTLLMYVVRSIFSRPERLRSAVAELVADGSLPADAADGENTLKFLIHPGGATSLTDAAYRFARHETGGSVVLTGTGERAHLRANVESILSPALPAEDLARLRKLFGTTRGVGLDRVEPAVTRS